MFRGGEGALQCLPPLIDALPEARLNLVIYHLKQGNLYSPFKCMLVISIYKSCANEDKVKIFNSPDR